MQQRVNALLGLSSQPATFAGVALNVGNAVPTANPPNATIPPVSSNLTNDNKRQLLLSANQFGIPNTIPGSTLFDDTYFDVNVNCTFASTPPVTVLLSFNYNTVDVNQLATSLNAQYPSVAVQDLTDAINEQIVNAQNAYTAMCNDLDSQLASASSTILGRMSTYNAARALADAAYTSLQTTADQTSITTAATQYMACFKALLGQSFPCLPRFACAQDNTSDLYSSMTNLNVQYTSNTLKYNPIIWFQQAATTHPKLRQYEEFMMLAEGMQSPVNAKLSLQVAQLPIGLQTSDPSHTPINDWLCLPLPSVLKNLPDVHGCTSFVFSSLTGFDFSSVSGVILDTWEEVLPFPNQDTAFAYQYNKPNNEAPQTVLLLTPPDPTYKGSADEYVLTSLLNTLDLTHIRTIDTDAMTYLGTFLPALFLPQYTAPPKS
jgi:hypothetical protein